MKKSTLLMVLSLVLALTIGLGTTLAYLTDTDADVNVMTLGNVDILQNEQERDENGELQEFTPNKPLYPAVFEGSSIPWAPEDEWVVPGDQAWKVVEDNENVVDKFVTVTNTGKSDAYVRTFFAFESTQDPATQGDYVHAVTNAAANVGSDVMSEVIWLPGTYQIDGSYYQIGYVTYTQPVQPGETTIPSLKQIYMNKAADNDYVATFGDTYEILVLSQAVQTAGFDSAEEALNEAFPMDDDYANVPGWFTDWTEDDIGSPGDEWPNNNPPSDDVLLIKTSDDLKATAAEGGELYLMDDVGVGSGEVIFSDEETVLNGGGHTVSFTGGRSNLAILTPVGGTIKNVTVDGKGKSVQGIGAGMTQANPLVADLTLEQVTVDGVMYAVIGTGNSDVNVFVKDSKIYGAFSYIGVNSIQASNTTFGVQNSMYDFFEVSTDTSFENCVFEDSYCFMAYSEAADKNVVFTNCTVKENGVETKLTAENFQSLLIDTRWDYSSEPCTTNLKDCIITVDGVPVVW